MVGGKLIVVMSILEKKDLKSITLHYGSRKKKKKFKVKENRQKEVVKIKVEIKQLCLSKSGPAATNQRHFSHDQV